MTRGQERGLRIGIVVVLLGAYEGATRLKLLDGFDFIPLTTAAAHAIGRFGDGEYWTEALVPTLLAILGSLAAGAAIGILAGVALWRWDLLNRIVGPWLLLVYAIPLFALFPVFVALLGSGALPVIVVGVLFTAPVVAANTAIGFKRTRAVLGKVGRAYGLSTREIVLRVYVPSAWPNVFAGLKLAASYSIIAVVGTEFILSTRGLGHDISFAYNNFDQPGMYGSILVVLAFSALVVTGLGAIERRLATRSVGA